MHQPLRTYSPVPSGFVVVMAVHDTATTTITVCSPKDFGVCPSCGTVSLRVHSRYHRRVGNMPLSGRSVKLLVVARRFRCDAVLCGRQIFAERFADDALAPWARRTARLDHIVHHLGLALGGRPAASFSQRLMLPVSKDTLLRMVRRRARVPRDRLNVIGIDDWARRRNHSYGTSRQRRRLGLNNIRKLPSSLVTAAVDTVKLPPRHSRMPPRSPIVGI
jgi:transposase